MLLADPQKQSYFPDQQIKSKLQMLLDHLRWLIKYGEINHYYYTYGFDIKRDIDINQYFSKKQGNRIRDRLNNTVYIGSEKTSYVCLLRDKFVFGQYMKSLGFQVPHIMALCDKEVIIPIETGVPEPLESFQWKDGDYFFKEALSGCGEGVYPVRVQNRKIMINDREAGAEGLRNKIQDLCLVQEKIIQHSVMAQLNPNSVNTLRLVTAMKADEPVLISGLARIGIKGSRLDNWSAGGMTVGIDIEKGTLKKYALRRPEFAEKFERHPDTQAVFENFEIPLYDQVVQAAIEAHKMFYGLHSVGWDIAITEDGPVFIEGNNLWEIPMMQVHDNRIKEKYLATVPGTLRRL